MLVSWFSIRATFNAIYRKQVISTVPRNDFTVKIMPDLQSVKDDKKSTKTCYYIQNGMCTGCDAAYRDQDGSSVPNPFKTGIAFSEI
jgi:hypothetical protein